MENLVTCGIIELVEDGERENAWSKEGEEKMMTI